MKYISTKKAAEQWGITARRVSLLASQGRIEGAELVGNTWLIPENARKPDARRKGGGEERRASETCELYPFPIAFLRSEEELKKLTPEERELYRGSVLTESSQYAEGQKCAAALLRSEKRSVRLGALYQLIFNCLYQYDYRAVERYTVMFLSEYHSVAEHGIGEKILLQSYEMEIGHTSLSPEINDGADFLSCPPELMPSLAVMKLYVETMKYGRGGYLPDLCSYGIICAQTETLGYLYSAMHLNLCLSVLHGMANHTEDELRYAARAVELAAKYELVDAPAHLLRYSPDSMKTILQNYPSSYSEKVYSVSKTIMEAHAGYTVFQRKQYRHQHYYNLSAEEYRLITYCMRDCTNEQIAELFGLSRAGINKRLAALYRKLRVKSKKELCSQYLEFIYDWNI